MKRSLILLLVMSGVLLFFTHPAQAAVTFNFYETVDNTPGGTPSDVGPEMLLGTNLDTSITYSGIVVLLDNGDPSDKSTFTTADFSDIFLFYYKNGDLTKIYGKLYSDPLDPVLALNAYNNSHHFLIESITGVTLYASSVTSNQYYIHSGPDVSPVPEPSTMLLLGSGLAGLVGYGRKRFKK